jgi:hypothetical protein
VVAVKPSRDVEELAAELAARRRSDPPRPILLFLGTECGEAAGIPGPEVMASVVLEELRQTDPDFAHALLPESSWGDEDEMGEAFLRLLGGMSGIQRYRVLQPFYSPVGVPLFYRDLAALIAERYFPHILTTNWDSLLEQALDSVGLRPGVEYTTVVLSLPPELQQVPEDPSRRFVSVIKLHGDLGQSQLAVTEEEIEVAIRSEASQIKGELIGDVLMVGYKFESPPVDRWMSRSLGAKLWWVGQERPDHEHWKQIEQSRHVTYIHGETAQPDVFFGLLATHLLRLPVAQTLGTSLEEYKSIASGTSLGDDPIDPVALSAVIGSPSDEELEAEYFRGQLQRSQEVKQSLEQNLAPGEKNPRIEELLDYQRKQLSDLQDQVLSLDITKEHLIGLVERIDSVVDLASKRPDAKPAVDWETSAFLSEQVGTIVNEAQKDTPNQHVLSAALGAVYVIGQRLGPEVVPSPLLSELASFAPAIT